MKKIITAILILATFNSFAQTPTYSVSGGILYQKIGTDSVPVTSGSHLNTAMYRGLAGNVPDTAASLPFLLYNSANQKMYKSTYNFITSQTLADSSDLFVKRAGTTPGKDITGRLIFSNATGNVTALANIGGQLFIGSGNVSSNLSITSVKGYTQYAGTGFAKMGGQNGASNAYIQTNADGTDGTIIISAFSKGMKGEEDYNILNPNDSLLYTQQGYIKKFIRDSIAALRAAIGSGGGGGGIVNTIGVTTANGVSGTSSGGTDPRLTISLGAITPSSVAASGNVTGSNLSGTNTGDQTTITGNAGTSTALQSPRTIGTITGDASSAGSNFDGTANNANSLTLNTVNSNVGSFTNANVTVDAKGRVTAVSNGSGGSTYTNGYGLNLAANVFSLDSASATGAVSKDRLTNSLLNFVSKIVPDTVAGIKTFTSVIKARSGFDTDGDIPLQIKRNGTNSFVYTANDNIKIGTNSLNNATSGENVGIGLVTLINCSTGFGNLAIGTGSLSGLMSGSYNVANGYLALGQNNGDFNSAVGYRAGYTSAAGSNQSFFGRNADASNGLNNTTAIGTFAYVTQDNSMVLGGINGVNGASADTKVGIGTTAPSERLDVVGKTKTTTLQVTSIPIGDVNTDSIGVYDASGNLRKVDKGRISVSTDSSKWSLSASNITNKGTTNVKIGGGTNASAILEVVSNTKGSIPAPLNDIRFVSTNITSPTKGLQAIDSTTGRFMYYDGTGWNTYDDFKINPFAPSALLSYGGEANRNITAGRFFQIEDGIAFANFTINTSAVTEDGHAFDIFNAETTYTATFTGSTVYQINGTTVITTIPAGSYWKFRRINGKIRKIN